MSFQSDLLIQVISFWKWCPFTSDVRSVSDLLCISVVVSKASCGAHLTKVSSFQTGRPYTSDVLSKWHPCTSDMPSKAMSLHVCLCVDSDRICWLLHYLRSFTATHSCRNLVKAKSASGGGDGVEGGAGLIHATYPLLVLHRLTALNEPGYAPLLSDVKHSVLYSTKCRLDLTRSALALRFVSSWTAFT